ncbi:MAG: shikimate kinase [Verrucomicrobiota bacterium]|nr:shikimate kinase [Verrucomicrobiota bacterium]
MSVAISIIGLNGADKSIICERLSQYYNVPLLDTDKLLPELYNKATGEDLTESEIFEKYNQEYFAKIEAKTLEHIRTLIENNIPEYVLQVGQRVPLNPFATEILPNLGTYIYLEYSLESFIKIIKEKNIPGLFSDKESQEKLKQFYNLHHIKYTEHADITLQPENLSSEEIIKKITANRKI